MHELWVLTYWFAVPIGVLVIGLIVWCLIRYRKKPGSDRKAKQFQYHVPLEITYTVIPFVIVAIIFAAVYKTEDRVDHNTQPAPVHVLVNGFQWGWSFQYTQVQGDTNSIHPNFQIDGSAAYEQNISNDNNLPTLVLPVGETVQFRLQSLDVNHSFYIPETLMKRDLIGGINNIIDMNFTTTTPAGHPWIGECTQFCGTYHPYMRFQVEVLPVAQFNQWASQHQPNKIYYAGQGVKPPGSGVPGNVYTPGANSQ